MGSIKELTDKISFRLLATRKHEDYDWLEDQMRQVVKPKSFLDNKWVKIIFSISIMGSAIPSIYPRLYLWSPRYLDSLRNGIGWSFIFY